MVFWKAVLEAGNSGIYAYTLSGSAWGAVREAELTTSSTHPSRKTQFQWLDDEYYFLGRRWAADRFDFVDAIGTEWVKTNTVLGVIDVTRHLTLELNQLLAGNVTFKERVLRPVAKASEDFVNPGSPTIVRNVVGDDVPCVLTR